MEKNIFQVWFQGADQITDASFRESVTNWKLLNKDWNYFLMSDRELRAACLEFSDECGRVYNDMDLLHLKVDLGRYVLIYLHGGIYVDMDMFPVKSLDSSEIIRNLFKTTNPVWAVTKLNICQYESLLYVQQKFIINNSMMIASKKNPHLRAFIHQVIKNWMDFSHLKQNSNKIEKITGPVFLNKFYQKNKQFMTVLPYNLFEPCNPHGMCDVKKNTIAIHRMELSWLSDNYKKFIRAYYETKPFVFHVLFLTLLFVLITIT